MILAAGAGTRLRPLTQSLPKPMVPVGNIPLLKRTISLLHAQNITQIAVNLNHYPEAIVAAFGDTLHYSFETELLGTAGGVKQLEEFFDEPFLVLYGDNLYDFDIATLIDFHNNNTALATIATFTAENPSACGLIATDSNGRITRFQEKPPPSEIFTDQANAGVYVLEPEILKKIPSATHFDFGLDLFPRLLSENQRLFATPLSGTLRDTGTIASYRQANWDVIAENCLASDVQLSPEARLLGKNCLGARCQIGPRAELTNCILWDDVVIGADAILSEAILGRGVRIGAGVRLVSGTVLGDGEIITGGEIVTK
jgi:NDP-sugar pyrophosphorylase family protein